MVKIILHDKEEVKQVSMSELVSLEASGFDLMPSATPPIKLEKVHELSLVNPANFPPIEVVHTDVGYVVINGRHRQAAIIRYFKAMGTAKLFNEYGEVDFKEQDKLIAQYIAGKSEEQKKDFTQVILQKTPVTVRVHPYKTSFDVNLRAMTANFENGDRPKGKTKTAIALDLFDLHTFQGVKFKQKDIATMAGITGAALSMALRDRDALKNPAPVDGNELVDTTEQEAEQTTQEVSSKLEKKLKAVLAEVERTATSDTKLYNDLMNICEVWITKQEESPIQVVNTQN